MILHWLKALFNIIFATADRRVNGYVKCICWCKARRYKALGLVLSRKLQRQYGVFLPYAADFDNSLILRHPIGIIIGEGTKIGRNVTIFQNVTLGRSDTLINAYPCIGDNTIIYSGAVILGDIKIGSNCIVGANAVVTKSIPDNSIAVGVPARIIDR